MPRQKICPLLSIGQKELKACIKSRCMLYKDKSCGLMASYKAYESVQEQPEDRKKKQAEEKLQKLFDGPEEKKPETYLDCKEKKNDTCYQKDNGIKKYEFCITCAQDKFRWQDQANRWGNFIIKAKQKESVGA